MSEPADFAARREDVGAQLHRVLRRILAAETALLDARDVEMWDYAVLAALRDGPAQKQAQLAAAIGRDRTRLIASLDRLAGRGLVERDPDPDDRRNRIVTLTPAGRELLDACRGDIRAMEAELLADVPEADRAAFLRALDRLAERAST
ncbi:MarR family winged helix-turn-helix transcriptional regulator [Pseudonocardia lacus]|uniref:MarR family winged helix-turn-helix transcriptional regulator n=1 Tax=Pseudonocardia lacus TaxID=2835865 RepID=UPI001BDCA418|nr:MarR family winged helix-turn-helix transcriptional regulator [Pseudonocardia lacus]